MSQLPTSATEKTPSQPQTTANRPRVGVSVFILRPTTPSTSSSSTSTSTNPRRNSSTSLEFITGRRLGSHGAGTWALPGGHLEYGEDFATCASREVLEETGLQITNIRYLTVTNDVFEAEGKHYITIFVVAQIDDDGPAEPVVLEPGKCSGWEWATWDEVERSVNGKGDGKRELFLPLVNLVKQRPGVVPLLL